jgi:large subunit ribosomal protein L14
MIQKGTKLVILDNCGGRIGRCIHVYGGYRKRYAKIGTMVAVAVQNLRRTRGTRKTSAKLKLKIGTGSVAKALIIETRSGMKNFVGDSISFHRNACVLLTENDKIAGTRVYTSVLNTFRQTRYTRLLFMADGVVRF